MNNWEFFVLILYVLPRPTTLLGSCLSSIIGLSKFFTHTYSFQDDNESLISMRLLYGYETVRWEVSSLFRSRTILTCCVVRRY